MLDQRLDWEELTDGLTDRKIKDLRQTKHHCILLTQKGLLVKWASFYNNEILKLTFNAQNPFTDTHEYSINDLYNQYRLILNCLVETFQVI